MITQAVVRSGEAGIVSIDHARALQKRIVRWLTGNRFAFAAFLIPLGIRAIPEVLVGPYLIGWDTISFYVPNTMDWALGKASLVELWGTAPLLYMISVPVYVVSNVNPVWIFKVMGPILYGSMIFALFRFLRLGLDWNNRLALGGALLTSLYFVTLRVSWDFYRNMLGLTFILVALVQVRNPKGLRVQILLAMSIIAGVAADQLTGVIVLTLVGSRALAQLLKRRNGEFRDLVWITTPGVVLFFSILYVDFVFLGAGLLERQPPLASTQVLSNSVGFLAFAYLPLIPLVALGFRRVRNAEVKGWILVCVALALTALLPFFGLNVMSYRWTLLAGIPICILAARGLARIGSFNLNVGAVGWLRDRIIPLLSIAIVMSASLYIALPAQQAMPYYAMFPGLLPTSMVQDTVPLSDMGHLKNLLAWVLANTAPQRALITHQAIYGWARLYAPSVPIVNYGYSSPLEGVRMARDLGYSSILMIWWVNGSGLHGQPNVPSRFVEVALDGDMAVYATD